MDNSAQSLLLDTPRDFSCLFLDKWIAPKDVVKLDSAFCTNLYRTDFLDLLKANEYVMSSTKSNPLRNFDFFRSWIIKRQVKLSHVEIGYGSSAMDVSQIDSLVQFCAPHMKSIGIIACKMSVIQDSGYDPSFDVIAAHCHRLERIQVQAGHLPAVFRTILANNATSLRSLHIAANKWSIDCTQDLRLPNLVELRLGKAGEMRAVDPTGLQSLQFFASSAPKLRAVFLKKAQVVGTGLAALATHCTDLQEITLELVMSNAQSIVDHCPRAPIVKLQCYLLLTHRVLEVFNCGLNIQEIDLSGNVVSNEALNTICVNNPTLACLKLARSPLHGPNVLQPIATYCTQLKLLDLSRCVTVTMTDLIQLVSSCTTLISLNIDWVEVNDAVLVMIGKYLKHLEHLTINKTNTNSKLSVTELGIKALLRGCLQLKSVVSFDAPPEISTLLGSKLTNR